MSYHWLVAWIPSFLSAATCMTHVDEDALTVDAYGHCHKILIMKVKTHIQDHSPTTVGSRSTYMALGTWRPELPVLKKVLNGLSRVFGSAGPSRKTPSGPMPCSRQRSSQQAFPVWTPAWPTWIEMHSLWTERSSTD